MHREKDSALHINPPAKRITRSMTRPKPSTPPVKVLVIDISTESLAEGTVLDIDLSQELNSPRYFTPTDNLQEYSPPLNEVYEEISPSKPPDSSSTARIMPLCLASEPHHSPKEGIKNSPSKAAKSSSKWKRKYKKLKGKVQEYEVLNRVLQDENAKYKTNSVEPQK